MLVLVLVLVLVPVLVLVLVLILVPVLLLEHTAMLEGVNLGNPSREENGEAVFVFFQEC